MKRIIYILSALILAAGLVTGGYFYWRSQHPVPLPPQPFSLLILGDSIAQGVGSIINENSLETYLEENLRKPDIELLIENKAVSGSKTEEVINNQLTKLQRQHYSAAVLVVGTNDITHLVGPSTFEKNYANIVKTLSAKADRVVLANIPQFSNTPIVPKTIQTLTDSRTKSYNNKISNIANGYNNVKVFNFFSFSQNRLHGEINYIAADGFHPNDAGYQLISFEITKKITAK